jgi:hypothetical protein
MFYILQDAVSALLARTSAELLAVEQELAQEKVEPGPEEQQGPEGDWYGPFFLAGRHWGALLLLRHSRKP